MIKNINYVILGWSNYFIPSPNQYTLRKTLDLYVNKRESRGPAKQAPGLSFNLEGCYAASQKEKM